MPRLKTNSRKMKPFFCPRCGAEYQVIYKPQNKLCEKCRYDDMKNEPIPDPQYKYPHIPDDDNLYI